jgi:NAD(P)-dependent dehydrogenase (short-subunit alcohol dehydrogenase family)
MTWRPALLSVALLALSTASAQAPDASGDQGRLAAAVARLQPQQPGVVDAFVVVAALNSDPVFNREAREAGRVLARRFSAEGKTVVLADDHGDDRADAAGTPANLGQALARTAALMDRGEDVLVLYTTSHGSPHAGLNFEHSAYGASIIAPAQLAAMLDAHGLQNRLIILQACFSGQFIPALATPRTVIATAASAMNSSFGCSPGNDWTFFGHALINQAMRKADSFARQFRRAVVTIIGWERKLAIEPSNPQIQIGSEAGPWLAALDARAGAVPPTPVGLPPSELAQ